MEMDMERIARKSDSIFHSRVTPTIYFSGIAGGITFGVAKVYSNLETVNLIF